MPRNFQASVPNDLQLSRTVSRKTLQIAIALLLVYIVWGTTYFGLAVALQTMPPIWMNGSRFVVAGLIMLALARWRGVAWPTRQEWMHSALVGGLMVFIAMNLVGFAQKMGIGSGLMATVVATMPMWLTLWTRWGGESVPITSWIGLMFGVLGALLLALEGDFSSSWQAGLLAFGAPVAWSIGSYLSRKIQLPKAEMAPAAQWLSGGVLGVLAAMWVEPMDAARFHAISSASWWAWLYLVGMGTLVALNAYLWLLQHTSPTLAGSYSFVNPAVALLVGVSLGGEHLTGWVFIALPLIGLALALLMYGPACVRWWHGKRTHARIA
jgi:drug/metabolite transporter (DMT)-like permease